MQRKFVIQTLKSFLCGVSLSAFSIGATLYASAFSSTQGSISVTYANNQAYNTYNTLYTGIEGNNSKYARGYTDIETYYNQPYYYFGADAKVTVSGVVVVTSNWYYNDGEYSSISKSATYKVFSGSPYAVSAGQSRIWNGSTYITVNASATSPLNDYT